MSGLIWVQTVYKKYISRLQKSPLVGKGFRKTASTIIRIRVFLQCFYLTKFHKNHYKNIYIMDEYHKCKHIINKICKEWISGNMNV